MSPRKPLYLAFFVSGVAGLAYEVVWTRYLGLYVGHSAYAQVLVLAVYLGGMALGAVVLADISRRIVDPVRWYASAESVLALFGIGFHGLFVFASRFSYDTLFPALGSAGLVGSARWAMAGLLILPQAMVLGATFPLMAAAVVRADAAHPGGSVARVYLVNTLGGAAGVLLAGFWMIGAFGLPGASAGAGVLNLIAAGVAFGAGRQRGSPPVEDRPADTPGTEPPGAPAPVPWSSPPGRLTGTLLAVSFGTALASFAYEIGWNRMLALVLGSATHSFELMLSAFVLGLALGAWLIRGRTDRSETPVALLGHIQVLMGLTAVLSVALFYGVSFDAMSWLVDTLPGTGRGYALFNVSRYGLCLLVMLPSTVLAGTTLPLITGTLLRAGRGEEAIGRVYGLNTIGSVVGAALAGLVALPWLGLKGLILSGGAVDVLLGLWLLERSGRWSGTGLRAAGAWVVAGLVLFTGVGVLHLDRIVLTSGVYRNGIVSREGERIPLYYADGRTATVSASLGTGDGVIGLATNGKPDASISSRWLAERRDTLPVHPVEAGTDFTTQILAPSVALAFRPDARSVANIGHGSGMTATTFLASERVERVVTIEIEPRMLEGSLVFLPANAPAVRDPRSSYVFDDAKSFFAYEPGRFDVVFAEPSNPWVTGTASLFTEEFYRRIVDVLADGGVLAQWVQLYELDDDLFLSVVAALDRVFPSYRAYLVGGEDVAIVASADGPLPEPDWSVLANPGFRAITESAPHFEGDHMEALLLFDESTLRPLLDAGVEPNSDFRPILDLGAERARFEGATASGTYGLGTGRADLPGLLQGTRRDPIPYRPVPAFELTPVVASERAAWLRGVEAAGGGIAPEDFPEWQNALMDLETFLEVSGSDAAPVMGWETWSARFRRSEAELHWGTVGWADTTFYRTAYDFLDRADAPSEVRATVDLRHGLAVLDWEGVAAAADLLVSRVAAGESWETPGLLLDAAVLAYLRTERVSAARHAFDRLAPLTGRADSHLRNRLLDALIARRETSAP